MNILVTGFSPFGGETINPAYEAVKLLPDSIENARIIKAELPTVFRKGAETLRELISKYNPAIVICVGQAGGRSAIAIERVAVNLQDAGSPDNEGTCPEDESIISEGRDAYFSNLPTRAIVQALKEVSIPAVLSYTAGTYVCNDVMYHLLHWIEQSYPDMRGGFIHVPYDPAQAAKSAAPEPSMPIAVTAEALRLAILTSIMNIKVNQEV